MEAEPGNDAGQDLAGPVSPSPSPGEEPRDLDQLQPGSPQPQTEDVQPPDYDTLSLPDLPPVSYEEVVMSQEGLTHTSLTVEAPPSYVQLFGRAKRERTRQGGRRTHPRVDRPARNGRGGSRPGQQRTDGATELSCWRRDWKQLGIFVAVVAVFILVVVALPVSMIAVGFQNYSICQFREIPLYLIVTGFVILVEVAVHSALFVAQKCSDDESTIKALRRCDFLALFLLIWLLVGSNWIFRQSRNRGNCMDMVDTDGDVRVVNTTNGTVTVAVSGGLSPSPEGCQDCSNSVYVFTGILIICQYVLALCLIAVCCSRVFRSESSRSS